jgi:hypothetical protein
MCSEELPVSAFDPEGLCRSSGLPLESLIQVDVEHRLADNMSLKAMVRAVERAGEPR